jgi:hypothetical protein
MNCEPINDYCLGDDELSFCTELIHMVGERENVSLLVHGTMASANETLRVGYNIPVRNYDPNNYNPKNYQSFSYDNDYDFTITRIPGSGKKYSGYITDGSVKIKIMCTLL